MDSDKYDFHNDNIDNKNNNSKSIDNKHNNSKYSNNNKSRSNNNHDNENIKNNNDDNIYDHSPSLFPSFMSPLSSSPLNIPMTRIVNTPISIAVDREMYNTKVREDDDINQGEKDTDRNNSSGNEFKELTIRDERQANDRNFNREISRIKIGDGNEDRGIERYVGEDHRKKAVERSAIVLGRHRDKELNFIVSLSLVPYCQLLELISTAIVPVLVLFPFIYIIIIFSHFRIIYFSIYCN